jgi:hypothetical protein
VVVTVVEVNESLGAEGLAVRFEEGMWEIAVEREVLGRKEGLVVRGLRLRRLLGGDS